MKAINFAILGFGGAGRAHAKRLQAIDGVDVKVIFDPKISALDNSIVNLPGIHFTDNLNDLIAGKIDAVSICTPDHTHFEYAKLCVQNNLHTMVEKPMFVTRSQCFEMEKVLEQNDVIFGVHHQMRYVPAFMAAHELVQKGCLGKIVAIEVDYIHDMRQRATFFDNWRLNHENPQNIVLGALSHTIDLIRWIVNEEVEDIFSFSGHKGWKEYPDVDTVIASLRFKSGVLGKSTTTISSSGPQRNTISIYGTKGQIHNNIYRDQFGKIFLTTDDEPCDNFDNTLTKRYIETLRSENSRTAQLPGISVSNGLKKILRLARSLNKLTIKNIKIPIIPLTRILVRNPLFREFPLSIYTHDQACEKLLNDFVSAIRGDKDFPIDFSEGRQTIEICLCCIDSYKNQKVVPIAS